MMIAVKLSEFITLCGILRGSIYIDGFLSSFFCFALFILYFLQRVYFLWPGFELLFRWLHRAVTQNEPPHVHVSGELELFIWRRRCTSCTSDPSYRVIWNTSLLFFVINTELILLKSQITNQCFNDQGNSSFASLVSVPFHFANYCSNGTEQIKSIILMSWSPSC